MFCGLRVVQPASTKRDGSILIKIDKASLKISLGKTHLVENRAAKFWLEAEAGFAGTGKNLYWASGRLGTKSHWYNHFYWIKKCSRKENNFNYQNAIMCKQKGIEDLVSPILSRRLKIPSSFCILLMMEDTLASCAFSLLNSEQHALWSRKNSLIIIFPLILYYSLCNINMA